MNATITIRLELTKQDARLLGTQSTKVFVRDQPCRFEPHGKGDHLSPTWDGGWMTWCTSAAEALLLRSYEAACGFEAMLLWDLAVAETEPYPSAAWVVMSTRPFPYA